MVVLTQWSIYLTSVRSGQLTGLAFGHAGARRRCAVAIRCANHFRRFCSSYG